MADMIVSSADLIARAESADNGSLIDLMSDALARQDRHIERVTSLASSRYALLIQAGILPQDEELQ